MKRRVFMLLLLAVACALLARLGFWQLSRADEKRARFETYVERIAAPPLEFGSLASADLGEEAHWRRVRLSGHYREFDVLLDNRTRDGRVGYEVLTPFRTDDGRTVLVDRGWVEMPGSREALPDAIAPADPTTLEGYLGPEPVVGIALDEAASDAEWLGPRTVRVQRVMIDALAPLLGYAVAPAVVYLDHDDELGALDTQRPQPGDGSAKHKAYAVQWFTMAGVLALIGLWNLRRKSSANA